MSGSLPYYPPTGTGPLPYSYGPQPTGYGSSNASSYGPTGTAPGPYPSISVSPVSANSSNATCGGGATLNVLHASLDWWWTATYVYAVSTFSIQLNSNDSATGWTLLPATTPFNVTSALAEATYSSTPYFNTYVNSTLYDFTYYTTPTPVAAATTIVTQTGVVPVNATSGTGQIPDLATTPAPASIVIPESGGVFATGTPFVYFSAYEIIQGVQSTQVNGSVGCVTTTATYQMTAPFSFEYTGIEVNGSLEVGADVTGDVNPAFLGIVNETGATAGSWVAAPTVAVVVEEVYAAEIVAAAHTEISQSVLITPTPTLPTFLSETLASSSGGSLLSLVSLTAHVESTETFLVVPTPTVTTPATAVEVLTLSGLRFTGQKTFIVHIESTVSTLILPTPTDVGTFTTSLDGETVTATALDDTTPTSGGGSGPAGALNGGGSSFVIIPFVAHQESTEITLDVPVPATQTLLTTTIGGTVITATALSDVQSPAPTTAAGGGGASGLVSAILSVIGGSSASPTLNALSVLKSAEQTNLPSPNTVNNVGSGSQPSEGSSPAGSTSGGSQSAGGASPPNNAGSNNSPSQNAGSSVVAPIGGTPVTIAPNAPVVVGTNTIFPGAPATTISGTPVSVGTGGVVIGGTTHSFAPSATLGGQVTAGAGSSSSPQAPVITLGGSTITANPAPSFVIGGQTVVPGGAPITVSGTVISAAPSGTAIVIGGSTVPISGAITASTVFTVNGVPVTANPTPAFSVGNGQTLQAGGSAVTAGGSTFSLGTSGGSTFVVVNGVTSTLPSSGAASLIPLITVGSTTYTANAATEYNFGPGETLTPGGTVVVSGTTISLGSSASSVVVNGVTQALSPPGITAAPDVTVGGTAYAPSGGSTYDIGGSILTPGGVITVSGTTISLASSGSGVVINGVTQTFGSSGSQTDAPVLTIAGTTYTANSGSSYLINGQTLTAGGTVTLPGGTTLSLASGASDLVINGATSTIPNAQATITAPPVLTVDGQTFAASGGSSYVISGQTLSPGGAITFSGASGLETVSLASNGASAVVVQGGVISTEVLRAASSAPALTIDGQTYSAVSGASGATYVVDGQTLTPGGTITVSGPNGVETVSLDSAGTAIVDVQNGKTTTSAIAGAGAQQTNAPVLTIDGETFTPLPGSGTSYLIDGQTLTPGGMITEVIGGHTFVISLSPSATILLIEEEGPNGKITATQTETLFPGTKIGTMYMTEGGGSTGRSTGSAEASSTGGSGGAAAGLQGAASSNAISLAGICGAFGSLALAIWL